MPKTSHSVCSATPLGMTTAVQEGDRVEIYRPLPSDPKEKRKRRAPVAAWRGAVAPYYERSSHRAAFARVGILIDHMCQHVTFEKQCEPFSASEVFPAGTSK